MDEIQGRAGAVAGRVDYYEPSFFNGSIFPAYFSKQALANQTLIKQHLGQNQDIAELKGLGCLGVADVCLWLCPRHSGYPSTSRNNGVALAQGRAWGSIY